MTLSRRRFLGQGAPLGLLSFMPACAGVDALEPQPEECCPASPFQHGVASGDPLADSVILWTRVTPPPPSLGAVPDRVGLDWRVAEDAEMTRIVASGTVQAAEASDFTAKVDVGGLAPDTTYYYDFAVGAARSLVGRTKTLPSEGSSRARVAVVSCANYPAGLFTVYARVAARADLDLVLHLGDYLYEYGNGTLGDGQVLGRLPDPDRELVTLEDYRARHAQYKRDPDLLEVHRQHPMVAIWDDHEVSNNAYRDGAGNHQPESEGDWDSRKRAAMRAYFEWMPIRPAAAGDSQRVHRQFRYGDLFDLVLLDTRFAGRVARIVGNCDRAGIEDPARSLLGAEQESWLFDALRSSRARGAAWRIVGQQVMMGQLVDTAQDCVTHPDQWDGYAPSRARLLDVLASESLSDVVILTGDAHSSWAFDLAPSPFDSAAYDAETGRGSLAVELVAPSVSSPSTFTLATESPATHPHLKFNELLRHGYLLVDITPERVQGEWYLLNDVRDPEEPETLAAVFQTRAGDNHLVRVEEASLPRQGAAPLAP